MSELKYKTILGKYSNDEISVEEFIDDYFALWKADRDSGKMQEYDIKFRRLINRIFTSCDCYDPQPSNSYEITEKELKAEIQLLAYIWWG